MMDMNSFLNRSTLSRGNPLIITASVVALSSLIGIGWVFEDLSLSQVLKKKKKMKKVFLGSQSENHLLLHEKLISIKQNFLVLNCIILP